MVPGKSRHAEDTFCNSNSQSVSPESKQALKPFDKYRTKVDYNKAYIFPYEDALLDTWTTLRSDIERLKAMKPVPEDALAEAEEELAALTKQMVAAGFFFST